MKKIYVFIICLFLFASVFSFFFIETTIATNNTLKIWAWGDSHVDDGANDVYWEDAISDSNTAFIYDISLGLGDMIESDHVTPSHDDDYAQYVEWKNIRNSSSHDREDFYCLGGNHEAKLGYDSSYFSEFDPMGDSGQLNNNNRPYEIINRNGANPLNNSDDLRYYFDVGNIRFIMMGVDDDNACNGICYYDNYNWWVSIIENSSSYNVIMCTHLPLIGVGMDGAGFTNYAPYVNYLESHTGTHTVSLWVNGDHHWLDEPDSRFSAPSNPSNDCDCYFINVASIELSDSEAHSYLFTFTEGSTTLSIGDYRHDTNSWDPSGNPGNVSVTLDFAVSGVESEEDPDPNPDEDTNFNFLDICGEENNSLLVYDTRWFNASKISETIYYEFQIATDSDFINVFCDINDINETNYGVSYSENSTHFFFRDTNTVSSYGGGYGSQYYRYRSRCRMAVSYTHLTLPTN